jgi:hypothetical protein
MLTSLSIAGVAGRQLGRPSTPQAHPHEFLSRPHGERSPGGATLLYFRPPDWKIGAGDMYA